MPTDETALHAANISSIQTAVGLSLGAAELEAHMSTKLSTEYQSYPAAKCAAIHATVDPSLYSALNHALLPAFYSSIGKA